MVTRKTFNQSLEPTLVPLYVPQTANGTCSYLSRVSASALYFVLKGATRKSKALPKKDESLLSRLKSVLTLQTFYRDSIRSVRESLGVGNALSHFNSMSSLGQPGSQGARFVTESCFVR